MKITNSKLLVLAEFSILAVLVYTFENYLPKPLPFLKIGLANIFILLILWQLDLISAIIVSVSKVVIGSLLSGLIFTPVILFSLVGSITSLIAMYTAHKIKINFSLIGVSIIGAIFHNISQLIIAYFLFFKNIKIFYLVPLILIMGLVSGLITGSVAYFLNTKINLEKVLQSTT